MAAKQPTSPSSSRQGSAILFEIPTKVPLAQPDGMMDEESQMDAFASLFSSRYFDNLCAPLFSKKKLDAAEEQFALAYSLAVFHLYDINETFRRKIDSNQEFASNMQRARIGLGKEGWKAASDEYLEGVNSGLAASLSEED